MRRLIPPGQQLREQSDQRWTGLGLSSRKLDGDFGVGADGDARPGEGEGEGPTVKTPRGPTTFWPTTAVRLAKVLRAPGQMRNYS